ncbi:MAG: methionyl-tRNA formyltransferase [Deltaproteobacteria bacterium]|nr:methionyl-tRNA formyltransferase [Deltaproteobacteria bacterium]
MSKLIFFGTPDFAVLCLAAAHEFARSHGHELVGLVCQPDKPSNRGHKTHPPATKVKAEELGLKVWQPERIKSDWIDCFAEQNIDLGIVVAYGKILPGRLLSSSRLGFVNVHASLLPRWRGAAPIQRAIEAGDAETGVSIMHLVPEMDAGDVYEIAKMPIGPDDTSGSLFEKLALLGAETLIKCLSEILDGSLKAAPQPQEGITFANKVQKEEAHINWNQSAEQIVNHVRAMQPWPGSYGVYGGKKLRLFGAQIVMPAKAGIQNRSPGELDPSLRWDDKYESLQPGQIVGLGNKLIVQTRHGWVGFSEAQLEGKRKMPISSLLNGFEMKVGETLC